MGDYPKLTDEKGNLINVAGKRLADSLKEGEQLTEASGAKRNAIKVRFDLVDWSWVHESKTYGHIKQNEALENFWVAINNFQKKTNRASLVIASVCAAKLHDDRPNSVGSFSFDYLTAVAHILHVGATKYGDHNWKKGLTGVNSGLNHAIKHMLEWIARTPCDYGDTDMHLAQVGVNLMFEYYFLTQGAAV